MHAKIIENKTIPEFDTAEHCFIKELSNTSVLS